MQVKLLRHDLTHSRRHYVFAIIILTLQHSHKENIEGEALDSDLAGFPTSLKDLRLGTSDGNLEVGYKPCFIPYEVNPSLALAWIPWVKCLIIYNWNKVVKGDDVFFSVWWRKEV